MFMKKNAKIAKPARTRLRALSIRQPYVEMIFRGAKKAEYRNRPTNIRGLIYIYAGLKPGNRAHYWKLGVEPDRLPKGLVVGTVELVDCRPSKRHRGEYDWVLKHPKRLKRPFKPTRQPQPAWFYPR